MGRAGIETQYAKLRVIRGTRVKPLPLLPSRPGGVCSRPLHGARDLTISRLTRDGNFAGPDGASKHFCRAATVKERCDNAPVAEPCPSERTTKMKSASIFELSPAEKLQLVEDLW